MSPIPQRIVCLCPSLTEALFDMGAGPRVVGVTDWCVHPEGEVERCLRVGGTKTPHLDLIFPLNPDLVVVNEEENRLDDVEAIAARGIEVFNTFPKTVLDAAATMRAMGARVGCAEAGERIAREIEAEREKLLGAAEGRKPVRFAYLIWRRPYMTVNRDTFVHDLLTLAGAQNLFADLSDRYPRITAEQLFTARPDAILLPTEPYMFTAPHQAEVCADSGLPPDRVPLVDGELLTWYGSRTPKGLRYAGELLERQRNF